MAVSSPAANGYGWNNTAVTAVFTGTDSVSGVASFTPDTLVELEGSSITIDGYCTDNAGLISTAAVTVNIDTTAPVVSYELLPAANANGWNNTDVALNFACVDALSGPDGCPAAIALTGEGVSLSTSVTAYDFAGNFVETSVTGINIDRAPPLSAAALSGTYLNGYYSSPVSISVTSTDALSGTDKVFYSLDDVEFAEYQEPLNVSADGHHVVKYYARDNAGNVEAEQTIEFDIDATGPSISYSILPLPNANGWNNSILEVVFTGTDTLSGIDSCTSTQTVSAEGVEQSVVGSCIDLAGNITYATATVNVDLSTPVVTASAEPLANAEGWNNAPVTVVFTGTDTLSGISSCEDPKLLALEGAGQLVSGYCSDFAGLSSTASLTVNIDTTAPVISYTLAPAANAAGWNNSEVTIDFSCSDALSDVASCPAGITLVTEGVALSTGVAVSDLAGNFTETTMTGINIDRGLPASTASLSGAYGNGYYNTPVEITIISTDTLSGTDKTFYSLNNAEFAEYQGPVNVSAEGQHIVKHYALDKAGNIEAEQSLVFAIDVTGPEVTYSIAPLPNVNGWNNASLEVVFTGTDAFSGMASCTPMQTVTAEGAGQSVYGNCTDLAGNITYSTAIVSVDLSSPAVSAAGTPPANAAGWNNAPVTVVFTGTDTLSGIYFCEPPKSLETEGAGQLVSGYCLDQAGLSSTATLAVNIDTTAPVSSATVDGIFQDGHYASSVTVSITVTEALSGVAETEYSLDGGAVSSSTASFTIETEGQHVVVFRSKDLAGNQESDKTVSIDIQLPPVDELAPVTTLVLTGISYGSTPVYVPGATEVSLTAADDVLAAGDDLGTVATTYYSLNSETLGIYPGGLIEMPGGEHTVRYYSVDAAGNTESIKISSVTVDEIAPEVWLETAGVAFSSASITYLPAASTATLSASDNASGVKEIAYELNETTYTAAVNSKILELPEGAYSILYHAIDNVGNAAAVAVSSVTVDATPPVTTLTVNEQVFEGAVFMTTVDSVTLTAVDAVAGQKAILYMYDADFSTQAATEYTGAFALPEGAHTLYYLAMDNVGNMETVRNVSVSVAVPVTLTSMEISPSTAAIVAGSQQQFAVAGYFSDSTNRVLGALDGLVWNVDYSTVAGVSAGGLVTGVAVGTARVTVSTGGISAGADLTVISSMPATGLIGNWKLDESAGTVAADASGKGHPGTLLGGPLWTSAGKVGGALAFDGVNDYVNVGNLGAFPSSGTISFWMKSGGFDNYSNPFGTDVAGINAGIRFEEVPSGDLVVVIAYTGSQDLHYFGGSLVANKWYQIVLTWNSAMNTVSGYVDGE